VTLPLDAVLKAWCGHLLPIIITAQHDHLPGSTTLPR
jgi:hypothetical protein